MSELVFLLEEASAAEMLKGLLPRLLPVNLTVRYITFEGKSDLEKQLVRRLRGYLVPNAQFVVPGFGRLITLRTQRRSLKN